MWTSGMNLQWRVWNARALDYDHLAWMSLGFKLDRCRTFREVISWDTSRHVLITFDICCNEPPTPSRVSVQNSMTVFLIPSAVAGLRFAFPPPPFALLNVCYTAALMLKPDAGPHCSHFTPPRAGTPHTGRRCDVSDHGQHKRLRQTIRSAEDDCLLQEAARESERSSVLANIGMRLFVFVWRRQVCLPARVKNERWPRHFLISQSAVRNRKRSSGLPWTRPTVRFVTRRCTGLTYVESTPQQPISSLCCFWKTFNLSFQPDFENKRVFGIYSFLVTGPVTWRSEMVHEWNRKLCFVQAFFKAF